MVRKQGGLVGQSFAVNENVVDRCIAEIKRVDPTSLADKLLHVTLKTKPYALFTMNGFNFTTDANGNFSSVAIAGMTTPEIFDLRFLENMTNCVVCFIY